MTAAESESSRRDMQNRLILVSNGCNFDMFTAIRRSGSITSLILHDLDDVMIITLLIQGTISDVM